MDREQTFRRLRATFEAQTQDLEAYRGLDFNQVTSAHRWSLGGQLEHMLISNQGLVKAMRQSLQTAAASTGPLKTTFMGRMVAYFAGPKGNAPVPAPAMPKNQRHDPVILDQTIASIQEIIATLDSAKEKAIESTKMTSPLASWMKYNLTDAFLILAAHNERHLGQMSAIRAKLNVPS